MSHNQKGYAQYSSDINLTRSYKHVTSHQTLSQRGYASTVDILFMIKSEGHTTTEQDLV